MEIEFRRSVRPPTWLLFLPGGACVLLGILILVVPQLLQAIVATALILIGASLLSLAWRFRASGVRPGFRSMRDRFPDWR